MHSPRSLPHGRTLLLVLAIVAALACQSSKAASYGRVVGWGAGQVFPANGPTNITAISTAMDHSLALKADGTVFAWGNNMNGQCNVPAGLTGVSKIAAGEFFSVALKNNGSIVIWGANDYFQHDVPPGLTGVRDISAGHGHVLALKSDGTVVAWGCNIFEQAKVPTGLNGVKSILAAWNYSVAVKSNGTVVAWGVNDYGQVSVPGGLNGVTAVAGNNNYCMALRTNTTVTLWGKYPSPPGPLSNIVAIAAGETHAVALTSTNKVVAWGVLQSGAVTVPAGIIDPFAIAASWHFSAALLRTGGSIPNVLLTNPRRTANSFSVSLNSQIGTNYSLEYKNALTDPSWTALASVPGNGSMLTLSNNSLAPRRVYRVRAQ
jgi:Regulator of chromosome condensation (RCC1) repeat